jgi:anaerobic selenocysteine-containing dehydrogenase
MLQACPLDERARCQGPAGIQDGDLLRAYNDSGEMVMSAYVTSRIVPRVGHLYESTYHEQQAVDGSHTKRRRLNQKYPRGIINL